MRVLVIDNYDSFTFNLVQYLGELGAELLVRRNDQVTLDAIAAAAPDRIVVSPGPGHPADAGIVVDGHPAIRSGRFRFSACASATRRSASRSAGRSCGRRVPVHGKTSSGRARRPRRSSPASPRRSRPPGITRSSWRPTGWPADLVACARSSDDGIDHGAAAPGVAGSRRAVPPRVDPDRARAGRFSATSSAGRDR